MRVGFSHTTQKVLAVGIIFLLWVVSQYLGHHTHEVGRSISPTKNATSHAVTEDSRIQQGKTKPAGIEIPQEAYQTIELIWKGGPFLYEQDGITFFNRERKLPQKSKGYYREYTVPTPSLRHRGARRIVAGSGGELYYTDDHYRTFTKLAPP